jgi:hypothetical protein
VTSETRARPRDEEDALTSPDPGDEATAATDAGVPHAGDAGDHAADPDMRGGPGRRGSGSRLAPVLAVLLVLLLAAAGFLWFTRPGESAVRTGDYAEALQAARSAIVDYTSFDYLTLDDDIEQIRRVSVGDLRDSGVAKLDEGRAEITEAEFVVNTEVVGAGVTRVDGTDATVLLVVQATQKSTASPQAQISKYRIEVTLEKSEDRWLLSGIKGTETPDDD